MVLLAHALGSLASYSNKSLLIYQFALAELVSALRHKGLWYQSSSEPPWNDTDRVQCEHLIPWGGG